MGCSTSKQGCGGENRPEELGKCAAFSSEVRWLWLRNHTLFTFSELRALLKVFQGTRSLPSSDATSPKAPLSSTQEARAQSCSSFGLNVGGVAKRQGAGSAMMDKSQFLAVCEADEALRVCVGATWFAGRLFDVLDEDGDGLLDFERFTLGLSKLLKGPESEKLKLMYAAYDLSGVAPSEERSRSSSTGRKWSGIVVGGGKPSRRSKYLTLEDITDVLASASEGAYPTLLQFTTDEGNDNYLSGSGSGSSPDRSGHGELDGSSPQPSAANSEESGGSGEAKQSSPGRRNASAGKGDVRGSRDPETLAALLQELGRKNAASYAARAVSEFGQAQDGALTQKEFEKWALTGPVLRCRINEFSIDVDVAPFQGVRLA